MDTTRIERFAKFARLELRTQVMARMDAVLKDNSLERRESPKAAAELERKLKELGREQLVERTAYTWFNRFCALRFMEVRGYIPVRVVSPVVGGFLPEILAEAKQGHIDETVVPKSVREKVSELLSTNRDDVAYRLMVIAACNHWNAALPFMFEKIDDYTELLMPDDLLSGTSILAYTREAMLPDACENVEVIGWLYQFYIAEKKKDVFDGLKKNKKITPENIPAATQLFTPNWIVRYLVENSLGRLWMLNRPHSELAKEMPYYIKPENPETDFLKINSPEEIRLCDPACGSGHMLVYAFDLLYAIYEEEGYDPATIPAHILTRNLYGIEIDERAGELASFALTMKAREKQPNFFKKNVEPNTCVLQKIEFDQSEMKSNVRENLLRVAGNAMDRLVHDLKLFEEADNFGSLLRPKLAMEESQKLLATLPPPNKDLLERNIIEKCRLVLHQSNLLASQYHVVVTNPPYMGSKSMNARLTAWAKEKENYPDTKSNIFAMFIERNRELAVESGMIGMITMESWMSLSSFKELRSDILNKTTILTMAHLGPRAFDSIGGEVVSTTAFVLRNSHLPGFKGDYLRLVDGNSEAEKQNAFTKAVNNPDCRWLYRAATDGFKKIPGWPIAYRFTQKAARNCEEFPCLQELSDAKSGMSSCNSDLFLRQWFEVSHEKTSRIAKSHLEARESQKKWFSYNKGGGNRRWFGYNDVLINWKNDGAEIKQFVVNNPKDPNTTHWSRRLFNLECFFRPGITWSAVSKRFSCRIVGCGVIPGTGSKTIYDLTEQNVQAILLLLNSKVASYYLSVFSLTSNFEAGDVVKIPVIVESLLHHCSSEDLTSISRTDWNNYETSWDFDDLPLLRQEYCGENLEGTYAALRVAWRAATNEMKRLEEKNNRIFIDAYGLQDELATPEVQLKDITLTCNPAYRYKKNEDETEEDAMEDYFPEDTAEDEITLEKKLQADTIKEFVSYAVGCMFGRYSLDAPGLILANQGETLDDYLKRIPNPTFRPSENNVIPLLDDIWFPDDATEQFKTFLRTTFGTQNYEENIRFVEAALGKSVRDYFVKDFYNDHVKRYKKRPIYWLFSSPKGSFNALIYLHRYRPDTVNVVLNSYLREYVAKLNHRIEDLQRIEVRADTSQRAKTSAGKEIDKLRKIIKELTDWERDVLYPLGVRKIALDLDDGVKVNYAKLGLALKKIPGLEQSEE